MTTLPAARVPDAPATPGRRAGAARAGAAVRARIDRVGTAAAATLALLLAVMLGRVVQLQVAPGEKLRSFMSERVTTSPQVAPSGDIQDRRGRPLAVTRFGQRVFVDPTKFPQPPDEALAKLADALGMPTAELARRIVPAMASNDANRALADDGDPATEPGKMKRYVSVGRVLEPWRVDAVKALEIGGRPIPGVHLELRQVREDTAGEHVAQLVGMVGADHNGLSGAELLFQGAVSPRPGVLRYVRDASGDPMWVFPGGYVPPERGGDARLSIDLEIQRIVMEELGRGVEDADAAGARCVVLDPYTGEVLALADVVRRPADAVPYGWDHAIPKGGDGRRYRIIRDDPLSKIDPALARNRCVEDVYEPGSTFKAFMWSTCVANGATRLEERFDTHDGKWQTPYGRPINDVTKRPSMTWAEVLVNSSNIGMVQGVSRLPFEVTRRAIVDFGFGSRTGIGLSGESPGIVTPAKGWTKYTQTSVAMGYEVAVTPLQMARAFSVFCRTGELAGTLPPVRLTAAGFDGPAPQARRVLPARAAELTRETMAKVAESLDNRLAHKTGDQREVFRYVAFGKSGTARAPLGKPPAGKKKPKGSDGYFGGQYNVSFISGGPVENPRVVVLVVVDDPGPRLVRENRYYGALVAGPINRRIMERTLTYLGVPPSRTAEEAVAAAPAE